ncbi:ArsR/SmtB family transcription factor [Marinitoga litoralis]|jgi:ArsR family transcriptional regulator|uniref:ArsR/SmtB family transcription factor n=1 Tax=Marinitoga litoralis TaxID=570855 RepID=UPI0019620AC6|nr:metalloregulator ArsR/SmtB family transcription factor [Marinitoga litoralis]MBM7560226.1 ArsR family transcriptional regulator [Marinitoga litoralis]
MSDKTNEFINRSLILDAVEMYKIFADETRLKILLALLKNELCVSKIVDIVGISQSAVSHQLRLLKQMNIVKYRKQGKNVFYSLKDRHIEEIINMVFEHLKEKGD